MRLLKTTSLELFEFFGDQIPPYAILSHTWEDEEVSLQYIQDPACKELRGFTKIARCCAQAREDELDWVWIDTCCIDKSSSSELSEAINSMYRWYVNAAVCYVYLFDVPPLDPFLDEEKFAAARWFTRGWCLQELVAPRELEFYANDWTEIGTKLSLKGNLATITSIPVSVLIGEELPSNCLVAECMSWASKRTTTRVEDTAYCLLGIFNVNMPLLYGEGSRAMVRLQEEILKRNEDYSLFLWQTSHAFLNTGLLCDSPAYFPLGGVTTQSGKLLPYSKLVRHRNTDFPTPEITARGLRIDFLTRLWPDRDGLRLAWTFFKHEEEYVCITLGQCMSNAFTYDRVMTNCVHVLTEQELRLTPFSSEQVYLPPFYEISMPRISDDWLSFKLQLHSTTGNALSVVDVYPNHDLQRPQLSLYTRLFSLLECPNKLAVLLSVREWESEVRVVVIFKIFSGRWRCTFRKYSETTSLRQLAENPGLMQHQDDLSDRAMFTLSTGSYITAATKSRQGLYLAHITLLPRNPVVEIIGPGTQLDNIESCE
jgi:hypothetical protein